jgi:hypothetical protein
MVTIECCYYLSQPNPILTLKKISRKIASVERGTKTFPQVEKKYVTFGKVPQHSQLSYFFILKNFHFPKLLMNVIVIIKGFMKVMFYKRERAGWI